MEYELIRKDYPVDNLDAISKVLINRGIPYNEINHYLHTTEKDVIPPETIDRLIEGVKILIRHIQAEDDVMVQVDSDCDGYTSSAAFINYIYQLFPSFVENHISYRLHKGKEHGIISETVKDNIKLLVVPDAGSNDFVEHAKLKERGIDVLVIDHHEASHVSEDACIINNQMCDYPTKSLSGVGMVYKFCSYIDKLLGTNYANSQLDLVALGVVADMMDMRDFETRYLINQGIQDIRNPFIKCTVEKNEYSLKDGVTPTGISFSIAPYVNGMIRSGSHAQKELLFESMLEFKGNELIPSTKQGHKGELETRAEQAYRTASNVKTSKQAKARDEGIALIKKLIEEKHLDENKLLVICLDDAHSVDKNLTGLIANELMSEYKRPVMVLNQNLIPDGNENKIVWEGSARGYEKSRLSNFKQFLTDSEFFLYAEGHANAFGVGITEANVEPFIKYSNEALASITFDPCYKVDFILNADNINRNEIMKIGGSQVIWGKGVEEPMVAIENLKITKDNIILMSPDKRPTLKISLPNNIELIKFKSSKDEFNTLYPENGYCEINIVGTCSISSWQGVDTPQIKIVDYDIVRTSQYYF